MKKKDLIPDMLKEKGFLFGSRALNVHSEESDFDYYIDQNDFTRINKVLMRVKFGWCKHSYFPNSFEYTKNNVNIHLVCVPYKDIEYWHLTIRILKLFPIHLLKNKEFRSAMFQDLGKFIKRNTKAFI